MNSQSYPSLEIIDVASPCEMPWEEMEGDDRSRFCSACRLNVYDLTAMSREEAEHLVFEREGRTCVRFFRRSDGTVLTNDCPVGLRTLRRRLAKSLAAVAALVGLLTCGIAFGRFQPARSVELLINGPRPNQLLMDGPLSRLIQWMDPPTQLLAGELICTPPPPAPPTPTQTPTE